MSNSIMGVLLDVDGVVLDTERVYLRIVQETFRHYGVDVSEKEYVKHWVLDQTASQGFLEYRGLDLDVNEVRSRKKEITRQMIGDTQLMPGAIELLGRLQGKYPLGIVTTAPEHELSLKMDRFGIRDMFRVQVLGIRKTTPAPYRIGAQRMGFHPVNIAAVEDNPLGVASAMGAGCMTIAYPNGLTAGLEFGKSDAVVKSLDEINEQLLEQL